MNRKQNSVRITCIEEYLITFFDLLEKEIPPKHPRAHHSISINRYGSDDTGWENKLGLHLCLNEGVQTLFLDSEDFEISPQELVLKILDLSFQKD